MAFSDYLENEVLDHVLGDGAFTSPAGVYLGLSTADPGDDAAGLAEPSGNAYARVQIPAASLNAASAGSKDNSADITFPTATGSWGTITHIAIFDALSGGNMLIHSALTQSKAIDNGDTFSIPTGSLTVTLD